MNDKKVFINNKNGYDKNNKKYGKQADFCCYCTLIKDVQHDTYNERDGDIR